VNNPSQYIVIGVGEEIDSEHMEVGSNLDWITDRAKDRASVHRSTQVVYKLVPVLECYLEVTTKIITKELE
jgi:hypothetical protein